MSEINISNSRISLERIQQAAQVIEAVFLNSPQYFCEPLGELLNLKLLLKIETLNPIRSFKGRGADYLVSQLSADIKELICASAGNFGQAMAYSCRRKGVDLTVYAATNANSLKLERMRNLGATVLLHGTDFDTAKLEAKRVASQSGVRLVEDSLDVETVEGAGTIGLELLQVPAKLDFLLVALGNGALFNGIAAVMKAFSPATQMVAVQADGAPAMVESIRTGKLISHEQTHTIADGIAVRLPVPQALSDMQGLVDDTLLVDEASIIQAVKLLHTYAGIVVEPSGAVGIAAILQNPTRFTGKTVGTIVCGGNLTEAQMRSLL